MRGETEVEVVVMRKEKGIEKADQAEICQTKGERRLKSEQAARTITAILIAEGRKREGWSTIYEGDWMSSLSGTQC